GTSSRIVDAILTVFQKVQDVHDLKMLTDALLRLAPKLSQQQATDLTTFCVGFFVGKGPYEQTRCAELLAVLPTELTAEQSATVFGPFDSARNADQRAGLVVMMSRLVRKLRPEQVRAALRIVAQDMDNVTREEQRTTEIHRSLVRRIRSEPALFDSVLQLFRGRTTYKGHAALANLIAQTAPGLDAATAADAARATLAVFPQRYPRGARVLPARALAALAPKLPPDPAEAAADFVIESLKVGIDVDNRVRIAGFIAELPPAIRPEAVAATIDASIAAVERTTGAQRVSPARETAALGPRMSPAQTARARDVFVRALADTSASDQRKALVAGLAQLPPGLSTEQSAKVLAIARTELASAGKSGEAVESAQAIGRLLASQPEPEHGAGAVDSPKRPAV